MKILYLKIGEISDEQKTEFVIKHKDDIDAQVMVLLGLENLQLEIDDYKIFIKELEKRINLGTDVAKKNQDLLAKKHLESELTKKKQEFEVLKKKFRGLNLCIAKEAYDPRIKDRRIEITDSKQLLEDNSSKSYKKDKEQIKLKTKRWKDFLEKLKETKEGNGNGYNIFFNILMPREMVDAFPSRQFSEVTYEYCINKYIMLTLHKTASEVDEVRKDKVLMEQIYDEIKSSMTFRGLVHRLVEISVNYVNIEKLMLQSAYELEQSLEYDELTKGNEILIKRVLEEINKYFIENPKAKSDMELTIYSQDEDGEISQDKKRYSIRDIRNCLTRFKNNGYVGKETLEHFKSLVECGVICLNDISDKVELMYTDNQLKPLLFTSIENYNFIKEHLGLQNNDILNLANRELESRDLDDEKARILNILISENIISLHDISNYYLNGTIGKQVIPYIATDSDYTEFVDFTRLINTYNPSGNTQEERTTDVYENFGEIIAELCQKQKENQSSNSDNGQLNPTEDKVEATEFSEKFMETFIENYSPETRNSDIEKLKYFCKKGIVDKKSLIDWADESIINAFFIDKIITIDDLKTGIMPEDQIVAMYVSDIISNEDEINALIEAGVVNKNNSKIKEKRHKKFVERVNIESVKKISENSNNFNDLVKNKQTPSDNPNYTTTIIKDGKPLVIINPEARKEYIELFMAIDITDEVNIAKGRPFYNYKFYALPDENGVLGSNSVIIAERYYEDKDEESIFAVDNATYCFKYKDFAEEMTKNDLREITSFIAYHKIATDNKSGRWAKKLLEAVAKTLLNDDLKKYSKKEANKKMLAALREVYTLDELTEILVMCGEIDRGDYNGEVYEEEFIGR